MFTLERFCKMLTTSNVITSYIVNRIIHGYVIFNAFMQNRYISHHVPVVPTNACEFRLWSICKTGKIDQLHSFIGSKFIEPFMRKDLYFCINLPQH